MSTLVARTSEIGQFSSISSILSTDYYFTLASLLEKMAQERMKDGPEDVQLGNYKVS